MDFKSLLNNEITTDILRTIPDYELPRLRDIYKKNWPYAAQAYILVDQLIRWKHQKPNAGVRFTCPEGNWEEDGTFVAILTECTYNIYFFTLDQKCTRLSQALLQTNIIEWSKGPYICAIHEDQDEEMMKTLRKIGDIEFDIESTCWWLPKERSINFCINPTEDILISPLNSNHSAILDSIWPHSFPGSDAYLANLIEMNGGFGVFTRRNQKLCSWVMINDFGALAILQTLNEHKRKGFAAMLVKYLAKNQAKSDLDTITYIVRKNRISQHLFASLGFKLINNVRWVQFKRNTSKLFDS